jgi:hypothetical protein
MDSAEQTRQRIAMVLSRSRLGGRVLCPLPRFRSGRSPPRDVSPDSTLLSVTIDLHTRKGKHLHENELDFSSTESLIPRSS